MFFFRCKAVMRSEFNIETVSHVPIQTDALSRPRVNMPTKPRPYLSLFLREGRAV